MRAEVAARRRDRGLAAHAMNAGFAPVISRGVPALERDRIAHVDHTCLCAENYATATRT